MVANETANLNKYNNIIINIQNIECSMIKEYVNNINEDKHEFIVSLAEWYILAKESDDKMILNMHEDNIKISS